MFDVSFSATSCEDKDAKGNKLLTRATTAKAKSRYLDRQNAAASG